MAIAHTGHGGRNGHSSCTGHGSERRQRSFASTTVNWISLYARCRCQPTDSDRVVMLDISMQLLVVREVVVLLMASVVDVSDATVMSTGHLLVGWQADAQLMVGVACALTARVHERRVVSTLDEVTSCVDARQQSVETLVQRVVTVRQCNTRVYNVDKTGSSSELISDSAD